MKKSRAPFAAILLLAVVLTGCSQLFPDEEAYTRAEPGSGTADFSVYVALGNSLTAGYQSGALYESAQRYSYPALLARSMATSCEQPLVADPGTYAAGLGHLEVTFDDEGEVVLDPVPWPGGAQPAPLNATLTAPYHNLGIPGALTPDLLATTAAANCVAAQGGGDPNFHFDLVLRNGLGLWGEAGTAADSLTALEQAVSLQPTFLSLWIGNNEILGSATAGTDALNFSVAQFQGYYTMLLDGLLAQLPTTEMIVANIPPVTATPFFTTVPFCMLDADSHPIDNPLTPDVVDLMGWLAEEGTEVLNWGAAGTTNHLAPGDLVLLAAKSYIADGMGIPDRLLVEAIKDATGLTDPEAEAALPTLYPLHGTPLPANLTLTAAEAANIAAATAEFNGIIAALADARNIPVVDIHGFMADAAADGATWNGHVYTTEFGTGGLFSLDGVHPADIGQAVIAGQFIETINAAYGASLELPDLPEAAGRQSPEAPIASVPAGYPNLP